MRFYKAKIILLASVLVVGFLGTPAIAAKRNCTNAEKALVVNLRQQIFTISNQIVAFTKSLESSRAFGSSKASDVNYWTAQIKLLDTGLQKRELQISQITNKCIYLSSDDTSGSKQSLKNCTTAEKKAISSTIYNLESIQANKRNWDEKLEVAKAWSLDYSKPTVIRAQATSDVYKYSDYYQQELAKEQMATEQFNLLNSSCNNSGLKMPIPYLTINQKIESVSKSSGVQIILAEDESRDFSGGPFYVTENDDSSFTVNCTKPNWQGINLTNMSLFLVGSTAANPLFVEVFMNKNSPTKWIVNPVIKLQAIRKSGNNIGTWNFNGKFITSNSTSVCGLVTEKLGDLTQNFASDVKSIGLMLKPNEQLNSNYINSQFYTYLGGVVLKSIQGKTLVKTISGRAKWSQPVNEPRALYNIFCGVVNYLDYVWDGSTEISKVSIIDESGAILRSNRGDLFPVHISGARFEEWYRGANYRYSNSPLDEEIFINKKFTCEFNLVGKGSISKSTSTVVIPAALLVVSYALPNHN